MTKFELSQGKYILSQETVRKDCRSPLLISAAILFTIAVILAIPCILHLFDEEANRRFLIYLQYDIAMSADALQSWVLLQGLSVRF